MACHAIHWALHFHRGYDRYARQQSSALWRRHVFPPNEKRRVGVLGMGEIGRVTAGMLRDLGFSVAGWSRAPKDVAGVESYHGADQLEPFLRRTEILIILLPPTPATTDLIDAERLAMLPPGAFVVNMGRGEIIVDDALLAALQSGRLGGAALDVFREEPLPATSPFWFHPKVFVTPHAAGPTGLDYGARRIAANILLMEQGGVPDGLVDREAGY
jgi:glyoxylate/hydroxypyruvate reductase A